MLAVGAGHEVDVVAGSVLGRVGLLLAGWRFAVLTVVDVLTASADLPLQRAIGWAELAYSVLAASGLMAAALIAARRRVLVGMSRWCLLPLAVLEALLLVPQVVPLGDLVLVMAVVPFELARPVVLVVTGVVLVAYSRSEAVKHRAKAIYDAW